MRDVQRDDTYKSRSAPSIKRLSLAKVIKEYTFNELIRVLLALLLDGLCYYARPTEIDTYSTLDPCKTSDIRPPLNPVSHLREQGMPIRSSIMCTRFQASKDIVHSSSIINHDILDCRRVEFGSEIIMYSKEWFRVLLVVRCRDILLFKICK